MKKILAIMLGLAAVLALAGCGAEDRPAETHVFDCFGSIVDAEGKVVLGPLPNDNYYQILTDKQGRQTCIVAINRVMLSDLPDYTEDEPNHSVFSRYLLYDLQGNLQGELQAEGEVSYALAADGDYQKSLLVRNLLAEEGKYQVIGLDGKILAEREVAVPEGYFCAGFSLCLAEDFFVVTNGFFHNDNGRYLGWLDFYDWRGKPLHIPGDYQEIQPLGYYTGSLDWQEYHESPYFSLWRPGNDTIGSEDSYAIIDAHGNLLFETQSSGGVRYYGDDLFFVWRDNREIMLDKQGRQLYPQPAEAAKPEACRFYQVSDYNIGQNKIINNAGEVVLTLNDNDFAEIVSDNGGKQLYLMQGHGTGYEKRQNTTGQYLPLELAYTFYDMGMQEVMRTELDNREVNHLLWPVYSPDYDLAKTMFLADKLDEYGCYEIYDSSGSLLISKQLFAPGTWGACSAFMEITEKFILVNYVVNAKEPDADGWYYFEQHEDVYQTDGTPVELPQPYIAVRPLNDKAAGRAIGYIGIIDDGEDLLDEDLRLIGHYKNIDRSAWRGVFAAEQANKRGLSNMRGEWIYQENGLSGN